MEREVLCAIERKEGIGGEGGKIGREAKSRKSSRQREDEEAFRTVFWMNCGEENFMNCGEGKLDMNCGVVEFLLYA